MAKAGAIKRPSTRKSTEASSQSTSLTRGVLAGSRVRPFDVAAQIAYTAVGLVIAYLTAGTGVGLIAGAIEAFENVAVRAAVAAVAKGTAKVVVNKVAKGGNFEAIGNDGLTAFLGGAVEGVTDVILPSVGKGLVSPAYKEAMARKAEASSLR